MSPQANADPGDPVIPSKEAIVDAQQQVDEAQGSVASIEAQLAAADSALQDLGVEAGKAAEAYDGAVYRWQQADKAAATARKRAARAEATASRSRDSLAGYVVSHETAGTSLTTISSAMTATGTHSLINSLSDFGATSAALDARLQQWQAASRLTRVYRAQAEQALTAAADAKDTADTARQAAEDAVADQQAAVSAIGAQKAELITQLAAAQHTSVQLATERAAGLERLRQERLAEQRRLAALAQQREDARQAALAEERRQEQLAEERRQEQLAEQRREQRQHETPPADPPADPPQSPPPAGGASTAVAFAYAQLGEPYVWGAAGPDSWDCSGLTMGSWAAAGVYLPHYSVAQYQAIQHITFSQLRPGDLVYWGSSSDSNSIYHTAIYIGNGKIIQAPHTGAYVEISGIYDWILPNFYGRP